jgi:hypothetical protein
MLKKLLISIVAIVALGGNLLFADDDYLLFGTWTPNNFNSIYDVTGYIDTNGHLGTPGLEYVIFNNGRTGYIYKVEVNGDPNTHPNDINNTGPIAPRTFTLVSSSPNSLSSWGGADEFYVDDTGIYFGSGQNIKRWDFNWSNETDVLTNGNIYSETLARNTTTGEWWTANRNRQVYKYNNNIHTWELQFTYPSLAGSHHDGMEIINNTLYLSDMTSDKIIAYDLNKTTGIVDNTNNYTIRSYSASPVVEGMGYGPNQHFWIGGGSLYEVGSKSLVPPCNQIFHFNQRWEMQRSECDDINIPGFDDTLMLKINNNGDLTWVTEDNGTKAWLASLGFIANHNLTLKTGEGFWTYGKVDGIDKTVGIPGKLQNNFMTFENGVYTFAGFSSAIDLNAKFGMKPVELVYYYTGGVWHTWRPIDGNKTISAGQGLYVLPNGDFSMSTN